MDKPAHGPGRFARAFKLAMDGGVEQVGPRQFKVAGNDEPFYTVDLTQDPPCTCQDQWWAGQRIRSRCKHTLSAMIVAQDPSVIPSLMELAYQTMKRAEEAAA